MKQPEILAKNKGLVQIAIRTIIFASVLFGLYFFVFLYFRHTLFFLKYLKVGDDFYLPFLTGLRKADFINSALFTAVIFFIWNRKLFLNLKPYAQNYRESAIFFTLAILTQIFHYILKYFMRINIDFAVNNALVLALTKYAVNIIFVILLAISAYNLSFVKEMFAKLKRQIPAFFAILAGYFFLIQFFQRIWVILGTFVATVEYHLLKLTFGSAYLSTVNGISLGYKSFVVGISAECSGIDSLLLFLSIYTVLFVLDWNIMNRKRMFLLLMPGIIGTIAYNILRVYLLMLVGILYSPEFAIDIFHTNAGWILFLVFFIVFWHFASSWVYIKKQKTEEKPVKHKKIDASEHKKHKENKDKHAKKLKKL
ncbi:MAG: archaeosortase/exosortase family protein [archaeon]